MLTENDLLLFIGGLGGFELLLIIILPSLLWLWAIVDIVTSKFTDNINKLIWALVVIFIPYIGAILYLILGRRQKVAS